MVSCSSPPGAVNDPAISGPLAHHTLSGSEAQAELFQGGFEVETLPLELPDRPVMVARRC